MANSKTIKVVSEEVVVTTKKNNKRQKTASVTRTYKNVNRYGMKRSQLKSVDVVAGETIEQKCRRITQNKEGIQDGAPEIFTERKDGVVPGYNIRTDRWEYAAEAMDKVAASIDAKREGKPKTEGKEDSKVIDIKSTDGKTESTQGEQY